MGDVAGTPRVIRFGVFEVDLRSGELRKSGLRIRLQEQPFQILAMLLERPGEVVTREELEKKLWGADTFVDFEHGLATAVKKLREALGDSADNPRFIETLPRRGYRFIAPVDVGAGLVPALGRPQGAPLQAATGVAPPVAPVYDRRPEDAARRAALQRRWRWAAIALAGVVLVAAAVAFAFNLVGLRDRLLALFAGPPRIESIAVLPLENLSGDPDQEYFADGMTDALITNLGKISALRVISRRTAMHYKGTKKTLPDIARELNVDAVVEGAVLRSGDRVRITAQLIEARADKHLWAEGYERDLRDVLALQSEVARAIANEIKIKLSPDEETRLTNARPVNPEAYKAYLKGLYYQQKYTEEAMRLGRKYFEEAIQRDPNYALAYLGLSGSYLHSARLQFLPGDEVSAKTRAAAMKALELDETLAGAHSILGYVLDRYEWDSLGAEREFKRALELGPNDAGAHADYAYYLAERGRHEEAIAEVKRAEELDPLSTGGARAAWFYYMARRYDQAIEQLRRVLEAQPKFAFAHSVLGEAYVQKGMYEEAVVEFQQAMTLTPGSPWPLTELGNAYAVAGKRGEALKLLAQLKQRLSRGAYVSPYDMAVLCAGLGEKAQAFEWLEKARSKRADGFYWVRVDPRLDPLRSDPRFQDLLRRMNFPP
jgi:TolB-like protein/DNA-binding winged helix-turn-helix (wHTH) protein/Flp pilus assembly protein TadD